jgi:hypothetical protein
LLEIPTAAGSVMPSKESWKRGISRGVGVADGCVVGTEVGDVVGVAVPQAARMIMNTIAGQGFTVDIFTSN